MCPFKLIKTIVSQVQKEGGKFKKEIVGFGVLRVGPERSSGAASTEHCDGGCHPWPEQMLEENTGMKDLNEKAFPSLGQQRMAEGDNERANLIKVALIREGAGRVQIRVVNRWKSAPSLSQTHDWNLIVFDISLI